MKKKITKLSLNRETLYLLGGSELNQAVGVTGHQNSCFACTIGICGTGTGGDTDSCASCPWVLSCGSCIQASCGC